MSVKTRTAVLISGGGTTLKNLIAVQSSGNLNAEIVQIVSSNAKASGNQFAVEYDIPLVVIQRSMFLSDREFSDRVFQSCRDIAADLVVMGGFLKKLVIPDDFANRVINIHPSLIPAFSGKGFYGMNVHQAVIDYGCKVSGCTVHFVDNEYDHGPVIAQRSVDVGLHETPESLQKKVFQQECELYPWVINKISAGKLSIQNRLVTVLP